MKVSASLQNRFIPKFNGNHELPAAEQITVEIKWPNLAEREHLKSIRIDPGTNDFGLSFDLQRILKNHVGKIANLESEVNGDLVVIKDGAALAECKNPALDGLADEIKAEVCKRLELDEGEEKN